MIATIIGSNIISFLAGAYFGILGYRVILGRGNDRGNIEIYVKPKDKQ